MPDRAELAAMDEDAFVRFVALYSHTCAGPLLRQQLSTALVEYPPEILRARFIELARVDENPNFLNELVRDTYLACIVKGTIHIGS